VPCTGVQAWSKQLANGRPSVCAGVLFRARKGRACVLGGHELALLVGPAWHLVVRHKYACAEGYDSHPQLGSHTWLYTHKLSTPAHELMRTRSHAHARAQPQEKTTLKLDFSAEGIFGGSLVGVKGNDYIVFYDWEVRRRRVVQPGGVPAADPSQGPRQPIATYSKPIANL